MASGGSDLLVLTNQTRLGARLFFGACALLPLIGPAWGLRPWTIPFGGFAVMIWIIVLGSMALGLAILLAMLLAANDRLILSQHGVTRTRSGLFGTRQHALAAWDVTDVAVERTEWQDGPDRYRLRIAIRDMRDFVTESASDEADVLQLQRDVQQALAEMTAPR